jgi:hypothetical protein
MRIGIVLIMGALSGLTPAAGKTFSSAELDQWFQGLGTRERACGPLALWYCLQQLGRFWEEARYGRRQRPRWENLASIQAQQ